MAKIQTYDPGSSEVKSPLIAGLTEAANKISDALNMTSKSYSNEPLTEVYIDEDDRYRIYQVDMGKRLWLSYPEPIIRKNGNVIRPETDYFSVDPVGGSITFDERYRLTAFDKITADFTCVTNSSSVLTEVLNDILELKTDAAHNKGFYQTSEDLSLKNPTGVNGDFAIVGETDTTWVWDSDTNKWVDTHKATDLSNYYTKNETDTLLSSKEPTINPKEDISPSNYYFSGDKQWTDILYKIRNTTLEGYNDNVEGEIESTDNIVSAFSKVGTTLESKADKVSDTTGGNLAGLDETGNLIDSKLVITRVPMKDAETGLLDSDLLGGKEPWEYQSRKNLLDNWYFGNPVNQRRQTSYTSGYGIDRWTTSGAGSYVEVTAGGIKAGIQSEASSGNRYPFYQKIEHPELLIGKTVVLSVQVKEKTSGNPRVALRFAQSGGEFISQSLTEVTGPGVFSVSAEVPENTGELWAGVVYVANSTENDSVTLAAAKLELGDTQTLAHQDAEGNWVLSDAPPNFGEELLKCQRYQVVLEANGGIYSSSVGAGAAVVIVFIPVPVSMRVSPTIVSEGNKVVCNFFASTGAYSQKNCTVLGKVAVSNGVKLTLTPDSPLGSTAYISVNTVLASKVILDSNL